MNNDMQTIFSEFSDPYRRSLIDRICAVLVRDKVQIPRVKALGLWFAEIKALEALERDPDRLDSLLGVFTEYDLPRIWAGDGHASRVDRRSDTVDVSSGRPGRGDRGRSGSPAQASTAVRSRSEIRIPAPKGSDGRRRRIAGDPTEESIRRTVTDREGARCAMTRRAGPSLEVAHIMPNRINGTTQDQHRAKGVWNFLETFWSKEKVAAWKRALMPGGVLVSTEQVCNLITLDLVAHDQWDRGLIAFRPISVNEEQTEMRIAFHWLPLRRATIARDDRMAPAAVQHMDVGTPPSRGPVRYNYFVDMETLQVISSGHIFTVRTNDKEKQPLPSMELLELRWHLSRIAAMQGGADEDDDSGDDSDGGSFSVPPGSRSPVNRERMLCENVSL
ncbi:hypothetical protein E8E15_008186 [Penicillium rubens]|uniref:HNH nuclease domain-containing protein n=1 Tax=Penicillium chrysogenum TaxID=5076 RepID=A0A167UNX7_PENCH|nr:uncharacterized protein N7525_006632 [Penicillium rubens]KZN89463.1 hypothetical protein EN45_080700 [Penicillium chrysogenum]KAF3019200.1 hypothetical protein E8E15_008186 [Penicillium rubens]KAJ5049927.1 hypothetical protein NUH16_008450 [Penicillium rubens]KAJ5828379.1 hypothetical protein N7525_006632 [Penicillium rubens]KAJ5841894.1 hypothetical protein N7534_011724 [Penicillium rubens]